MTYLQLAYFHLATVIPSFFIGAYLLLNRKGTPRHKALGRVYMVLMLTTAITTLFMPARVGPTLLNHFGFIHAFSFFVLFAVPRAYLAAHSGKRAAHRASMVGVYCGGILIAGAFAFSPGRLLHGWLFG